uniref:URB1 ribosome biogenesis homolog n=1 Tax=Oncorhynchus kisutch TaxID=8019 RepID=A0A8C7M8L1_ONCKI
NKMGKKRSSEDVDESKTHAKKGKVSETAEFNGTVFKAMLKEPTKAMKGLDTFITTAKKLPCPDLYDVVEGYIKISMECSEIFKLLEGDKQMESEMMLIFQSLEMILLRTASDLSHFSMVGFTIVKKAVSSYMKLIQTSLHSENHRFVRHCLSFLSAMVSQGADTAREVFSHFHFTKGLSALAKRKDKMGRPDVRMAYTQFALSFLVSGDNVTIGQLLEMKDFLPDILSSGLKEDRISTVNLILSTLQTKVVQRQAISKTQKVRFFTPSLLAQIASLYRWNGIVTGLNPGNAEEAGKMVVRKLVHNFLLNLCCSRKHGISFYDPSFGTAGRAGNIVLLQFVVGLKQATEDDLVSDLMVNILRVSPDILPRFFKETQYSFIPRLKSAWTDNITLLKKIYESQPEVSKAFQTREVVPLPRLLSMVLVTSLPPVCNKAFFTQGINHTTLSLMSFLLKRAQRNIELCLDRSVWLASDLYTPATMQDFTQQYREALGKVLPDMTSIVSKWQSLTKKEKGGNEGKKEGDVKEDATKVEQPEVIVLKALILQVMCLYQKVVPHLVSQSKFDFSKLLKGIVSEKGMREEVHPVLQHQILQLALDLPAIPVNSLDSGVFEYTWSELELWLKHLDRLQTDQQDTVIHFLERVLMCLVCNPYTYTDKVASLVQEAAYLQANLSGQDGDTASIPISHIDDVLDMVDVIMEGSEGETEELGPALSDDLILQTFPFSAVVPAVLEARNKLPATYRTEKVLCDVLHCQRDPLPLSLALLQYDKELNSSEDPGPPHHSIIHLHHYYTSWLPQQAREPLFQSCESPFHVSPSPVTFTGLLKTAYTQGASALLEDSFRWRLEKSLVTMEMAEYPVAAKQILLYIKTTVDNCSRVRRNTHLTCMSVVLSVLSSILKHPCIEQWFLSLELSSVPPTSLNPVRLKLLCAQLSDCILGLLQSSASVLRPLNSLHLLSPYLEAVSRALLRELGETGERRETDKESRPVRAFMALHAYMEPSLLQELVSSLLLLPKEALITPGEGEEDREKSPRAAELSVYGRTALQVLTETTSSTDASSSGSPVLLLSQAHLQGLATLLLSCSSPSLETFLLQALRTQPGNAKLLHTDILLHCLQGPLTAATQALGVALLQNCSAHRLCFEVWCLQPQHLETLTDQVETFLPLVNSYLQTAAREDLARPKEGRWLWSRLLCQTHWEALGPVEVVEALSSLVRLTAKVKDIRELIASLCISFLSVPPFRWQLVDPISAVLSVCPEELELWRTSVLSAALRWLSSSYGHNRDQNTAPLTQEDSILNRLTVLLVAEWNSFVKAGLKCRYRDPNFLSTLNKMLDLMYGGSEGPKDLVPLPTIHMMASSHSLFLPIMLGDEEDLILQVTELFLLCAFKCLLFYSRLTRLFCADQNLLLLLQEYERNGISLVDFQCMLWGPAAVEHHKARRSLGVSLWQQPSSEDLLALLSPDTMINTITHFPLQRRIILQEGKELIFKDEEVKDLGSVYDPCFLLPLFSAMLQPESVIDCLKFVSSHGLGVTMVSLSSYDPKLRAAAYQVLASYHHHLEAARFREKRQLLYLLDMVKNGIRQQNLRMPFILTTYITKVARQMLKPEEHMYVVVNRFLLSHQCLDFRRVPEFFKLFYSCDMEHKMEREWILSVLEEGLKDRQCYDLLDQQGIFQTLLGFCCSPLCDQHTQTLIVRVLHQAGRVTKAAYNLTKGHGLLTWILQLLERRHVDQGLLSAVVELLHVLWFTNLGQKETRGEGASSSSSSTPALSYSNLSPVLTLYLFDGSLEDVAQFLIRVQISALSSQDALALLHRWSTLTHNAPLLSQLQTVAEKHKVKELLGERLLDLSCYWSGREKGRGRSSSVQVQVRSHSRPKEEEEEGEVERREEEKTLLEKCIPHLRNIFTHWEPVSLACPPSSTASPPPSPDPHTPTSTPLANTTAHLLTRWFLNSLVEGASTYEDKRTVHFLRWFQKTVLSHRFIVDLVLADPAVRVDLLRLYHQACEPQAQAQTQVEHVQLFTNIMIQLLESRGCTESDLHRAVLTACSLGTTCDDQTTKEGLMLLSLYIHEMWSGAKSPELFLNHVRLANEIQGSIGTKDQKKKSKRRSQTHTALRTICSDLLSGLQSTVAP